ncbi:MAG: ABC transporter permease [Nakamurella sp.]
MLWKLVRRQLAHRPRRLISVLVTVVIGVGFTAACITYNATAKASLAHQVAGIGRTADVLIVPAPEVPAKTLLAVTGVAGVETSLSASTAYRSDAAKGYASVAGIPSPSLRWFSLSAGSWPQQDRQVVVGEDFAKSANLEIGSVLTLAGAGSTEQQVTVAGTVADGGLGIADLFASPAVVLRIPGATPELVAVTVTSGVDPAQVVGALRAVIPTGADSSPEVLTGAQYAADRATAVTDGSDLLGTLLLGFAAIALLVAGIVIANVFTILTTARRRELALLRCVGATSGQVTAQVVLEGLVVGAVGSVAGVLAGYGAAAVLTQQLGSAQGGVVADLTGLLIALVAGILITTGAAAFPAVRTGRIAPLAALQPISPEATTRRLGILRVVSGLVLTLAGRVGWCTRPPTDRSSPPWARLRSRRSAYCCSPGRPSRW